MKTMTADQLTQWNGRIIDVRGPHEFAAERLPNAECVPLEDLPAAMQTWDRHEPLLVLCKSGMRSRQACDELTRAGFTNVTMLMGGIKACRKAGQDVMVIRRTLPIIRQVLIVAGSLLLLGLLLSGWHPRFLLVTWFVTAGLLFAGLTGYCPMAKLLAVMPWNRAPQSQDACACDVQQA